MSLGSFQVSDGRRVSDTIIITLIQI